VKKMKLVLFLKRYSGSMLLLSIIAGIASGAANTGLLAIINEALRNGSSTSSRSLWGFVALCLLLPATRYASEMLLTNLGQDALLDLRLRLSRQILEAPLRRLEEIGPHRLLATLTDDVPAITNVVTMVPLLCINLAIIISCLIYLGTLSVVVLLGVLACIVIGIISYQLPTLKALVEFRAAREQGDTLMGDFRALTHGVKELKLHRRRREAFMSGVLEQTATAVKRFNISGLRIYTAASSWGQALVFIVIGLVIFWLPSVKQIDLLTVTAYTITLLYLMTPLQVLMNNLPALARVNVALSKVEQLGLTLTNGSVEGGTEILNTGEGEWQVMELAGVTHQYKGEQGDSNFMLGPIDMKLTRGQLVFIVGGNGSGKTTLAKLMVGLYVPESGEVRLDGEAITDENRVSYREMFSVVFADFYLFESLLGLDMPGLDQRAHEYLRQFRLEQKVRVSDGVLSTTELSQGQRKRLALVTAYLENRAIYLFDEWAADQDPAFKEIFYRQLLPDLRRRGKTVLVISHDDRYYPMADRLIKLESGQVIYDVKADRVVKAAV
jgi:putative ATP-binding cassette transporter